MIRIISLSILLLLAGNNWALAQEQKIDNNKTEKTLLTTITKEPQPVLAGHIYEACKRYFDSSFTTRESVARKATCNGYFFAAGGMLLALQNENILTDTCVPFEASTHNIIKAFIEWGSKEDSDLKLPAPQATLAAIRQRYPCNY